MMTVPHLGHVSSFILFSVYIVSVSFFTSVILLAFRKLSQKTKIIPFFDSLRQSALFWRQSIPDCPSDISAIHLYRMGDNSFHRKTRTSGGTRRGCRRIIPAGVRCPSGRVARETVPSVGLLIQAGADKAILHLASIFNNILPFRGFLSGEDISPC